MVERPNGHAQEGNHVWMMRRKPGGAWVILNNWHPQRDFGVHQLTDQALPNRWMIHEPEFVICHAYRNELRQFASFVQYAQRRVTRIGLFSSDLYDPFE
jgi:hypothetical protein